MPAKSLYRMTSGDYELFQLGRTNANIITDYYFRSSRSGTFWRYDSLDLRHQVFYERLYDNWNSLGKPDDQFDFSPSEDELPITYKIIHEEKNIVFWYHHGWLFQPWQLKVHHSVKPDILVIAGFGSGKTVMAAMSLAVLAMTIPNFTGYVIAPRLNQAYQSFKQIITNSQGTLFGERFLARYPESPLPKIVVQSDYVGESTIEFFGVLEDPAKLRTIEGDVVVVEQMEAFDDLAQLFQDAGSRLRGQVLGRPRMGRMLGIANADINPEMWWMFNHGVKNPDGPVLSVRVKTRDNVYLSTNDLDNMKRRVTVKGIGNEKQWLDAEEPIGDGEIFSHHLITLNIDDGLDDALTAALAANIPGYNKTVDDRADVTLWKMPPDYNRKYVVVGDPGQSNPPFRNSGVIMVWDVTDFPERPVFLRVFDWVYGNGSIIPFVTAFKEYVEEYHAQMNAAFDSTGQQSSMDELTFQDSNLYAYGINLAGNGKSMALNSAKFLMGRGKMRMPRLPYIISQLVNYKLPDTKLAQDITMTIIMTAQFLNRFFWIDPNKEDDDEDDEYMQRYRENDNKDRHRRTTSNRYKRTRRGR